MRTRVFITVDVECAEERRRGSRVQPTQGWDLRVWGRFQNQREELGIRRIMNDLEACGRRGYRIERPDEIAGRLTEAFAHKGVTVLDVMVDSKARPPITSFEGHLE